MIVYGDSYTSGEDNNGVSFADYLKVAKCGVSGSCLGEYSIYPVYNGSFVSLYQNCQKTVLLEYGVNDAASLVAKYVDMHKIKIAVAQAADLLQNNDVYFLALTRSQRDLKSFCDRYADYLNNEYLRDLCVVQSEDYQNSYENFVAVMQKKFKTLYMLPDGFQDFSADGIHPTNKGHKTIATYLQKQLR